MKKIFTIEEIIDKKKKFIFVPIEVWLSTKHSVPRVSVLSVFRQWKQIDGNAGKYRVIGNLENGSNAIHVNLE